MRVIAKSKITEYCAINKDAEIALEEWYQKTKLAESTCFAEKNGKNVSFIILHFNGAQRHEI